MFTGNGGRALRDRDRARGRGAAAGTRARPKRAAHGPVVDSTAPGRTATVNGFKTPESVRYDSAGDVFYVSNINGSPVAKDNNGFISRMKPDGTIDSLELIAGGRNGVTLNAPKGLALIGDTLWVADIDAVRAFNVRTGAVVADRGSHVVSRRVPQRCLRWRRRRDLRDRLGDEAEWRCHDARGGRRSHFPH